MPAEKQLITDAEWYLVDLLVQDATVLSRHLGSTEREAEALRRLGERAALDKVVTAIKQPAGKAF